MNTWRIILYSTTLLIVLWLLWYSHFVVGSPFGELALYNTSHLATKSSTCEPNDDACEVIEYYWNDWSWCNIQRVTLESITSTKPLLIETQSFEDRLEEKWDLKYVFQPDSFFAFEKECYKKTLN